MVTLLFVAPTLSRHMQHVAIVPIAIG